MARRSTPTKPLRFEAPSTRRVAAAPTGRAAPTEPPKSVDPQVQAAMEGVRPGVGYALVRLVTAVERHEALGLPKDTVALLDSAMLRVLALHPGDDRFAADHPPGSVLFASLEGLAPLLGSHVFLLPLERAQGSFPTPDERPPAPAGFTG